MEKVLKYSILRYSPSILAGEKINLGILFSEESVGYHSFYYTRNLGRIKSFDDELNKSVIKEFLLGIEEEITSEWQDDYFDIDKYIKYYINDYKFESPQVIMYDDLNAVISRLKKAYFRFDFERSERPDKKADQKIIVDLIRATGVALKKKKRIDGAFNEGITFDIATENYYIKIFDFDDKDLKRCINTAKTWAWNCNHEKDKTIYIVYRYSKREPERSTEFSIIKSIFEETNAQFISMNDTRLFQKAIS